MQMDKCHGGHLEFSVFKSNILWGGQCVTYPQATVTLEVSAQVKRCSLSTRIFDLNPLEDCLDLAVLFMFYYTMATDDV